MCPAFWLAIESGLMIDSIMAMGRIFDDAAGSHSVNRLFAIAAGNLGLFSKEALAIRKQGNEPEPPYWLDEYLEDVFEPSSMDEFKPLRKQVRDFRTIYVDKYKDIRDRCLAHHLFVDENERWRLFQRTNTDEMAEFFGCFIRVCDALSGLLQNGTHPGQFQEWTEWQREEITEATSKTLLMLLPSHK